MNLKIMSDEEILASQKVMEERLQISKVISFSRKTTKNSSLQYFDVFKIHYKEFWKMPKSLKYKRKIVSQKEERNGDILTHHIFSDESLFLQLVFSENKIPEIPY